MAPVFVTSRILVSDTAKVVCWFELLVVVSGVGVMLTPGSEVDTFTPMGDLTIRNQRLFE